MDAVRENIAACKKAITAISDGMAGGFLQSDAANALRNLVNNRDSMDRYTRRTLTEFLSTSSSAGYAPGSGEIVGILKQLLEVAEAFDFRKSTLRLDDILAAQRL